MIFKNIKVKLKYAFTHFKPISSLIYGLIRGYSWTFRLTIENERTWLNYLEKGGTILLCTWHQQFFSAIHHFKNYKSYRPSLMISQSKDGDIIAEVARRSGWEAVRGSSSKGGFKALSLMIRKLRASRLAVHVVDGPKGPSGLVKDGIITMVHATDAVIVPFYVSADRAWYFKKSWDKFLLPKPFAKVTLHFGEMIKFGPLERSESFEIQRLYLENIMLPQLQG